MSAQLQHIINEIQAMRADLADLEVKLMRNEILRRDIPLNDDYAEIEQSTWLDGGFRQ